MAATAAQIAQLRRMVSERTDATYNDALLTTIIETYPAVDENGENPRIPSTTVPGEMMVNPDWTDTYDLHSAAASIWEEKAGALAGNFDFSADGGNFSRSQANAMMMRQARYHLSRRNPKTIVLVSSEARDRQTSAGG